MTILLPTYLFPKGFIGLTVFPFIFIREDWWNDASITQRAVTINHEKIHLIQQLELLVVFFFIWYALSFLYLKIKGVGDAYKSIPFEKEAYAEENNLYYLSNRKLFNFLKY